MTSKLPHFRPVTHDELRRLWTEYPDPNIRRLVLEVERGRRKMAEVDSIYASIQGAWHELGGGHLVALHVLKVLLSEERDRRK
ncbi:hypothetical protein [Pseudomonas schmalbachii]|uniref:Uncharacterized protein n=1 Tax=Pseudomonas schmalbachii TaxID=2816993 RepID=A0ABS3TKE0_9PSED|nr:hypothetical protein [Pseudomonas schmalbachii]MBO3274115.1 hypothetical protein [Pseudomonas schmalbachii]